ncbi:ParB/RepB/Spo0J family partition protein [uncultured Anaerococcus sp.]|uniref:ParB/RepB/Spo0J family partition protein n=1 Tax=uncultured Anaerococcus sp. TaxID=293428 RepID=UPI00288C32A1|nr:ParB/RepB/Spo0J family partition protein [uncultured Anaerococcus sp.]
MNNRRSLGRGLSSLIPDIKEEVKKDFVEEDKEVKEDSKEEVKEDFKDEKPAESPAENYEKTLKVETLPIEKVSPRSNQPRKEFDEKALEDLALSLKEYGLLNPIIVTRVGKHYEILAGERRFRASKLNGSETIDAIVKNFEEEDVEVLSLIENVQREDLSAIEEATAYKKLIDSYGLTQDEIAQKMGKSRSYIANTVRLLKLNEEEKSALREGSISPSQARSLLSLDDGEKREKALDDYKNKKVVVRDVEKISREDKQPPRKNFIDLTGKSDKKPKEEKIPNLDSLLFDDFEEKFMNKLATKVAIEKNKDAYKVVIDCYSIEDIEKIYDRIRYED